MKFNEYKELTTRTMKYLDVESNLTLIDSIHMCLGFGGEISELYEAIEKNDIIGISEEITDFLWYGANYCNIYNIKPNPYIFEQGNVPNEIIKDELLNSVKELIIVISKLQDLDKKLLVYEKSVSLENRKKLIELFFMNIYDCYFYAGIDAEKSMENNINKLLKRFPEKFTNYLANNRNLDAERAELEK